MQHCFRVNLWLKKATTIFSSGLDAATASSYLVVNSFKLFMESQQQPEFKDPNTPETTVALEPAPMSNFSPTSQSVQKGRWIFTQVYIFLSQLTQNLGRFWNDYKQLVISLALILVAFIALRVVFAVVDALNDIPLLAPTFQLIGIAYSIWFVSRYLLQESNRQELYQKFQSLLNQQ
jgi:hypothetical protein